MLKMAKQVNECEKSMNSAQDYNKEESLNTKAMIKRLKQKKINRSLFRALQELRTS